MTENKKDLTFIDPDEVLVESWEDADQAMKQMALRLVQIDRINADLNEDLTTTTDLHEARANPYIEQNKMIGAKIDRFAAANRSDLAKKKSWKGLFGVIKFRKQPDKFDLTRPEEVVISALEGFGLSEAIKTTKKLVKAELGKVPLKTLRQAGIIKKPGAETVKVEPNKAAIDTADPQ